MHSYVGRAWFWVGLLGLIATGIASSWLSLENEQRLAQELARQADRVAQQVESRFGLYEYGLRSMRGAILAGGGAAIRRETLAAYTQGWELSREFPGARGFGFIRRWPLGHEAEALRRARADGMANFEVRELAPNPGERFVIEYIYPQAANQGATGLDIASERNRRDAALDAARTASVRLTGPITLVQADQKPRQGFLMLLPVYAPGALPEDGDARLAVTLGWAYAPLLAEEVLKPLVEAFPLVSIAVGERDESRPFFETHPNQAATTTHRMPSTERTLSVFGRTWRLQLLASPALPLESRLAPVWLVLALGGLLSLLLALITRLATDTPSAETASERSGTGLTDFVRSPLARWSLLALLAVGGTYAALAWWQVREAVAARFERELQTLVDQRASVGETAMRGRKTALLYLRGTPPVDGLIRSQRSGRDPLDGSSTRFWQQRMAQIFGAYAQANPDAQELRLIRLAGTASQLVTWRRAADGASEGAAVLFDQSPDPARLRVLADLRGRLLRGEAWIHPVEAQKRSPPGAEPLRQIIRYTLPVLDGAALFGVLEIDVDVSARFTADALRLPWGGSLHVLNSEERWLTRQGLLEGPPGEGWSDRYTPAPLGIDTPAGRLRAWRGPQGEVLAVQGSIDPNPGDRSARVIYRAVVPARCG